MNDLLNMVSSINVGLKTQLGAVIGGKPMVTLTHQDFLQALVLLIQLKVDSLHFKIDSILIKHASILIY